MSGERYDGGLVEMVVIGEDSAELETGYLGLVGF